jgi:hypothetical protein
LRATKAALSKKKAEAKAIETQQSLEYLESLKRLDNWEYLNTQ